MLSAPRRLRCEYLSNPLGLDTDRPRLCWWPTADRRAELQSAYQIVAARDSNLLAEGTDLLWDSGQVFSAQTVNVPYAGPRLVAGQSVYWKVRTFDSDGIASPWSNPALFELGLVEGPIEPLADQSADLPNWQAQWISTPLQGSRNQGTTVPALRREFALSSRPKRARLYISALGLYRAELNGQRIGDQELAPGWTDYQARLNYQVFDVTDVLQVGANAIGVLLADGWYCGAMGMAERQAYGERAALIAQLQVDYGDGSQALVLSDDSWHWQRSAIVSSDFFVGESIDARQRLGAFSQAGYCADSWQPVVPAAVTPPPLHPSSMPPVGVVRELNPLGEPIRRLSGRGGRRWIYDFGQNLCGRVSMVVKAPRGTLLRVRHAQRLDELGELDTTNLGRAVAEDCYTCAGEPDGELFEPVFALHGFAHVEVSGDFPRDAIVSIKAQVIGARLESTGEFKCDHMLINRLQDNIAWSQRSNFQSIPADSPERDERLAWTNGNQAFARTAAFNMDTAAFTKKWLLDMTDAQRADGSLPPVVPLPPGVNLLDVDGGAGWSDALLICAWVQYRCFNDQRLLEQHYDSFVRFVAGLERRYPDGIRDDRRAHSAVFLGDWMAPDGSSYGDARQGSTASDLLGTAYFYYSARLLSRIAGVQGNLSDLERFDSLASHVRHAFRKRFVTPDGYLSQPTQTGLVLALHFGLLEPTERKTAIDQLVADIKGRNTHLATGVLGTPFLLHVLTAGGQLALAYDLLLQTSAPGWLYPVTQGATTIWESWHGPQSSPSANASSPSLNHCGLGSVGEWLYQTVAGLDLNPDLAPEKNAYRHAHIEPQPPIGRDFPAGAPLRYAEAQLDTVHGRFATRWEIVDEQFHLAVFIPVNCTATLVLPNGQIEALQAGSHEFELELEHDVHIPMLELNKRVS